eukprot:12925824-Prorocentrum_lima.AAC.1
MRTLRKCLSTLIPPALHLSPNDIKQGKTESRKKSQKRPFWKQHRKQRRKSVHEVIFAPQRSHK